jgi:hypothetical protein
MENTKKAAEQFSYKLDVRVAPHKKDGDTEIRRYLSNSYLLTKYHDSVSGLTMCFKGIRGHNDKQFVFQPVDDFYESNSGEDELSEVADFPLNWVFNFLFAIGEHFRGGEQNIVIKWPEYIEEEFQKVGVRPKKYEYEPDLWNIERDDKEFFELMGRPKISAFNNDGSSDFGYQKFEFYEKEISYQVKLKIFWPGKDSYPEVDRHIPSAYK